MGGVGGQCSQRWPRHFQRAGAIPGQGQVHRLDCRAGSKDVVGGLQTAAATFQGRAPAGHQDPPALCQLFCQKFTGKARRAVETARFDEARMFDCPFVQRNDGQPAVQQLVEQRHGEGDRDQRPEPQGQNLFDLCCIVVDSSDKFDLYQFNCGRKGKQSQFAGLAGKLPEGFSHFHPVRIGRVGQQTDANPLLFRLSDRNHMWTHLPESTLL